MSNTVKELQNVKGEKILQENESEEGSSLQENTLFKNCVYVVTAVIFQEDQVLLISEAKTKCYGEWYLPAGKVERQETLIDAFKRELLEESFIEGEPDHLLSIEGRFGGWFRFNFIGHKTGGRLKTFEDRDKESLEAKWFPISQVLNGEIDLRQNDIISVIRDATNWLNQDSTLKREKSLPLPFLHLNTSCHAILVDYIDSSVKVAVSTLSVKIPMAFCYEEEIESFFNKNGVQVMVLGLIALEHYPTGGSYDGICWNFLCSLESSENKEVFEWVDLNEDLSSSIKNIITKKAFIMIK